MERRSIYERDQGLNGGYPVVEPVQYAGQPEFSTTHQPEPAQYNDAQPLFISDDEIRQQAKQEAMAKYLRMQAEGSLPQSRPENPEVVAGYHYDGSMKQGIKISRTQTTKDEYQVEALDGSSYVPHGAVEAAIAAFGGAAVQGSDYQDDYDNYDNHPAQIAAQPEDYYGGPWQDEAVEGDPMDYTGGPWQEDDFSEQAGEAYEDAGQDDGEYDQRQKADDMILHSPISVDQSSAANEAVSDHELAAPEDDADLGNEIFNSAEGNKKQKKNKKQDNEEQKNSLAKSLLKSRAFRRCIGAVAAFGVVAGVAGNYDSVGARVYDLGYAATDKVQDMIRGDN